MQLAMVGLGRMGGNMVRRLLRADTIAHLGRSEVAERINRRSARPWGRVVIEKPFGSDFESAKALNGAVRKSFAEHQVYRIDHYIHHVQITAADTVGVEHRAGYYEDAGVVRDMFQNHLLQLMCLTAMEPPVAFQADAVRDEKAKVLHVIRRPVIGARWRQP